MRPAPAPDAELLALNTLRLASRDRQAAITAALEAIEEDLHGTEDSGVVTPSHDALLDDMVREAEVGTDLRRRMVLLPATTWPGVLVKIALVTFAYDVDEDEIAETLEKVDRHVVGSALTMSLCRDLKVWFGSDPAAGPVPAVEPAAAGAALRSAPRGRQGSLTARRPLLDDTVLLDLGRQWQAAAGRVRATIDKIYEVERRLAVPVDAEAPPELKAAQEGALAASDEATRLRQAIVRQPARTWAGLLVKLEVAASLLSSGSDDEEFEEALEEDENATGLALHMSMIRDFAALPQQPRPDDAPAATQAA